MGDHVDKWFGRFFGIMAAVWVLLILFWIILGSLLIWFLIKLLVSQ